MHPSMVHQLTNSIPTRGFMLKHLPVDTMGRDAGKARTKEAWVKAAKTTRAEEMKEAIRLLKC